MIIVDTNVLIDFMRHPMRTDFLSIAGETIAYCGVVQAEFLHGTRSDAEVAWLRELLGDMEYIDLLSSDWEHIGLFLRTLREHGLSVPFTDAVIAYLAIKHDCEVWTSDRHFALIKEITPQLRLFDIDRGGGAAL